MKYICLLLTAFLLTSASGCYLDVASRETLYIDSSKSVCYGMVQGLCFRSYESKQDLDNQNENYAHIGSIEDFDFRWGSRYTLVVKETRLANPPADGSSIKRQLISIRSRDEDSIGTAYYYENLELFGHTIKFENETYLFHDQPFTCVVESSCEDLLSLVDQQAIVNLHFVYLGNGEIALQNWS